jgi:hypothetical protein
MNLDELMSVWRSQDAAPLHDVNKTLLHLALREDEAKLQKARRKERWTIYGVSVGVVAAMTIFLGMMIMVDERDLTGWDFVIGIVVATVALLAGGAMYVSHRAQAQREERFGESLRDQLNRRIAQLDHAATRAPRTGVLVVVILGVIAPIALVQLSYRTNQKSISDDWVGIIPLILMFVGIAATGVWDMRRRARELLPRKRRLVELLKELDGR